MNIFRVKKPSLLFKWSRTMWHFIARLIFHNSNTHTNDTCKHLLYKPHLVPRPIHISVTYLSLTARETRYLRMRSSFFHLSVRMWCSHCLNAYRDYFSPPERKNTHCRGEERAVRGGRRNNICTENSLRLERTQISFLDILSDTPISESFILDQGWP